MSNILKRILISILILSLLLPLSSCSASNKLLASHTEGAFRFEVYGGKRARLVKISNMENGMTQKIRIRQKKSVGDMNGTFGFAVMDLNFDGYADFKIAKSAEGEMQTETVFLYDPTSASFKKSKSFDGLCTLGVLPNERAVLAFTHTQSETKEYSDAGRVYTVTDAAIAYQWKADKLVPYRRVSLTYFSERDIYLLSVADYSEETGSFGDSEDRWISPEEISDVDLSALYYFR
jgi:hypothetical protein